MKVRDIDVWVDFKLEEELEHFCTVEMQYSHGWRLPIDDMPYYQHLQKFKEKGTGK